MSGDLVDGHLLGDAAQRTAVRDRFEPAGFEQIGSFRVGDDRAGSKDRTRVGQTLYARRDIYGSAEIVLALVENDGQAGSLMDPYLEQLPVAGARVVEIAHCLSHAQRSSNRPIRGREGRHYRVAAGFDHGTRLGGDNLVEELKMRSDEVKRDQVANPLIEFGRAPEVREQERQAGDLQALIDVNRVGAVDIAKDLVRQQALCAQEGLSPAEKLLEVVSRDPQSRQHPGVGAIFEGQAQRPGVQLYGFSRRTHLVEDEGKVLAVARRLALDIEELGRVRHRVEDDHEFRRQLQRKEGLFARRKLDRVEGDFLDQLIEIFGQIDGRTPEYLAKVLRKGKLVRVVRRDLAHSPADCEDDLDDFVEYRLITDGAPN